MQSIIQVRDKEWNKIAAIDKVEPIGPCGNIDVIDKRKREAYILSWVKLNFKKTGRGLGWKI